MINIVIPMAGAGSRFAEAGYDLPKPFIDVNGKPMIVRVMENLQCRNARYILIARQEHLEDHASFIREIEDNFDAQFIYLDKLTEGTACTVLFARQLINNNDPLLIANSDQLIDVDIESFIDDCATRRLDGSILTFKETSGDTKWSYAKLDKDGLVVEVKEKEPISEYATVGIYLFSKGRIFVDSAIDMIVRQDKVNNEYYTCPVYNFAITTGHKIGVMNIDYKKMHGLGTPSDLNAYLSSIKLTT